MTKERHGLCLMLSVLRKQGNVSAHRKRAAALGFLSAEATCNRSVLDNGCRWVTGLDLVLKWVMCLFLSSLNSALPSLLFITPYGAVTVNTYLNSIITY